MHTEAHLFSVPNDCLWYDKLWGPSQRVVTLFNQWWSKLRVTFVLFRTSFQTEAVRGCVKCSKSGTTLWRPLVTDLSRKGGGGGVRQEGWLVPSKAKSGQTTCLELSAHHKINLLEHILYCAICCYLITYHKRQVFRDRRVGLFKYCAVKKLGVHYC